MVPLSQPSIAAPSLAAAGAPVDTGLPVPQGSDKAWAAAQKFEQMAIGQFLTPMLGSIDLSTSEFGGGSGEAAWGPMMTDAMAKQIETRGGLGLAPVIYREMLRLQEQAGSNATTSRKLK